MRKSAFQYFLKKEKNILMMGVLGGLILLIVYLIGFYIPFHETSVRLLIRNLPKDNIITPYNAGGLVKSESGFSNPLFNYLELVSSQRLAESVYKVLKEDPKYRSDIDAMGVRSQSKFYKVFAKLIEAKIIPSTDILKVDFKWNNRDHVLDVFKIVVQQYRRVNLDIRKETESKRREYLAKQLDKTQKELAEIKEQLRAYRVTNGAIDLENESAQLTMARVELEKEMQQLMGQKQFSDSRLQDLSGQLRVSNGRRALSASGVGSDPYLVKLNQDLASAQQQEANLLGKLTEMHPDVIQVQDQIRQIQENILNRKQEITGEDGPNLRGLYDEASTTIATDLARVQADAVSQGAQIAQLRRGIQSLKQQESEIPAKRAQVEQLSERDKTLTLAYENLMQKLMEAKIKEDQSEVDDNIVPLDAPTNPDFALSDLLVKIVGFISFGFLSGLAVAWIKNDIEDQWQDTDEIELVTGHKVLGVIPWLEQPTQDMDKVLQPSGSVLGIAYTKISNTVIAKSYVDDAQTIAFISTIPARRQSPVIQNVASTLSRLGKSVVLLELDFEHPAKLVAAAGGSIRANQQDIIHVIDEINSRTRLGNAPTDDEIFQRLDSAMIRIETGAISGMPHQLDYLCATREMSNLTEYLASKGFQKLLALLKTRYEFILVDTVGKAYVAPDVSSAASISDAAVVISGLTTNRQELLDVISRLEKDNVAILGLITRERNSELERLVPVSSDAQALRA